MWDKMTTEVVILCEDLGLSDLLQRVQLVHLQVQPGRDPLRGFRSFRRIHSQKQ